MFDLFGELSRSIHKLISDNVGFFAHDDTICWSFSHGNMCYGAWAGALVPDAKGLADFSI